MSSVPNALRPRTTDNDLQLRQTLTAQQKRIVALENVPVPVIPTIRGGTSNVTFPGGSNFSNVLNLAHGLGVVPTGVALTGLGGAGGTPLMNQTQAADATFIYVQMDWTGGIFSAGSIVYFSWLAFH